MRWPSRSFLVVMVPTLTYCFVATATATGTSLQRMSEGEAALRQGQHLLVSNPVEARVQFSKASTSFREASLILQAAPWYTKLLTPLPPFRWQVQLIKASHALAESGTTVAALSQDFPPLPESPEINSLLSHGSSGYFTWHNRNRDSFTYLEQQLTSAETQLSTIPFWAIPRKGREMRKLQDNLRNVNATLPKLRSLSTNLERVLGGGATPNSDPHRFLIIFQNDAELRPSGGFYGSFATLTASSGTIRQFSFGANIYKLDKPFEQTAHLTPPDPLQTITQYWAFRDSSVGKGFLPEISEQVRSFYEQESGETIEGIIYLDTSLLEDVLRITGPINLPGSNEVANSETITTKLTQYIEADYFSLEANRQTNEPKSILADLIPLLISKLQETPNALSEVAPVLGKAVTRKSIQVWATDPDLQANFGSLMPSDSPQSEAWIKIVNTNLGGLKSSRSVQQTVAITTQQPLLQERTHYDVTITRKHEGRNEWPDAHNRNFIEVYLPVSAEVVTKPQGIGGENQLPLALQQTMGTVGKRFQTSLETNQEKGWQRLSFWGSTEAGKETVYRFSYTLPSSNQSLTYLKQAGSRNETLVVNGTSYPVTENLGIRY